MRAFISLEIPEKIRKELFEYASELKKKKLFFGKVTELENIHLTLKFLGEIDESKIKEIREKLRGIKVKKFKAKISELGVFSENFVRIIWSKLEGAEKLQGEIDNKLGDLFVREKRFMGHVTIARVKNVADREKFMAEIKKKNFNFEFEAGKFYLKESILKLEGPEYKVVEEYGLE